MENKEYLSTQIITYLGNKRQLLPLIGQAIETVRTELNKDKISFLDLFSGSGIVARYAKQYSQKIIANDLENYSFVINSCYLANKAELDLVLMNKYYQKLKVKELEIQNGFISELYAPKDDRNIQKGERVFYTLRNANYLDNMINNIDCYIPKEYQCFFIAPLLAQASVHVNTAGVFKGFYKDKNGVGSFGASGQNALSRIQGKILLPFPIFSEYQTENLIFQADANNLVKDLEEVDICYIDPPYNQHPYGSNYFMLNNLAQNIRPVEISTISGIPVDWQRSNYNKKRIIGDTLADLIKNTKAKYILLSFNNEGFLTKDAIINILSQHGNVRTLETKYNTFRGSRNLNQREIHVKEYLFILKK